jgi:hypothetical protein
MGNFNGIISISMDYQWELYDILMGYSMIFYCFFLFYDILLGYFHGIFYWDILLGYNVNGIF